MELANACKVAGGFYDPQTKSCRLGKAVIYDASTPEEIKFVIDTPKGRFEVSGYTPRARGGALFFPFNNCGLEVERDRLSMSCFAGTEDTKLGYTFIRTFDLDLPL